jgi:hypothetical protein
MGLLDIWQDWRKESGYGRDDLTTAGGLSQRGKTETDPKYIRDEKRITTPRGRVVKQEGSQLPSADFQTRFSGGDKAAKAQALATSSAAKTPNLYQDKIMQGGTGTKQGEDPSWWQGLANKFNSKFDMDSAVASWKDKGGFEGLMANPAFTMGLAFMQSGAEGKTLGAGALDNIMKAGGISQTYKKIIEDRSGDVIEATEGQMDDIKGILGTIGISGPGWRKMLPGNQSESYEQAVEDITIKVQQKVKKMKKDAKAAGKDIVVGSRLKKKIIQDMIDSGEISKKRKFIHSTIEAKAQGGPVQAGKPYVVGEQGPEIIIPHSSGNVLSNDDSQIYAMLLAANPQLQKVSKSRAESILRSRFPEYFE